MGLIQVFILISCIFAGFYSISGLQHVNLEIDQINQKSLASIKAIGVIDEQLRAFRSTESDEIGAASPEALTSLEAMIEPIEESVAAAIKVYEPLVSSKQEKALFRQLQAEWTDMPARIRKHSNPHFLRATEAKSTKRIHNCSNSSRPCPALWPRCEQSIRPTPFPTQKMP